VTALCLCYAGHFLSWRCQWWFLNPFQPSDAMWHHTLLLSLICMFLPSDSNSHLSTLRWLFCARLYMLKSPNNWHLCSYVGWLWHIQPCVEKSAQCAKMTTGINGQKTCILRTDEKQVWCHMAVAYPGIFSGGFNKFSWRQRTERTGIWGAVTP
jgi:hypothetical protein